MKPERKWMRFKPLISSLRREGQAYKTVALKAFNVQPEDQRLVAHQEERGETFPLSQLHLILRHARIKLFTF